MTGPDACDRLLAILDGMRERATDSVQGDFRLTSHWPPGSLEVVHLFGKPYWWDRLPDGRLRLQPARWIEGER